MSNGTEVTFHMWKHGLRYEEGHWLMSSRSARVGPDVKPCGVFTPTGPCKCHQQALFYKINLKSIPTPAVCLSSLMLNYRKGKWLIGVVVHPQIQIKATGLLE